MVPFPFQCHYHDFSWQTHVNIGHFNDNISQNHDIIWQIPWHHSTIPWCHATQLDLALESVKPEVAIVATMRFFLKNTLILWFSGRSDQISDVDDITPLGLALESVKCEVDIDATMRFVSKKYPNPEIFMKIRTDLRNRNLWSVGSTSREDHLIVWWYGCDFRNQQSIWP